MKFRKLGFFEGAPENNSHDEGKKFDVSDKSEKVTLDVEPVKIESGINKSAESEKVDEPKQAVEENQVRFSIKNERSPSNKISTKEFIIHNREHLNERGKGVYGLAIDVSKRLMDSLYSPYFEAQYQIEYAVSKIYEEMKENPFFDMFSNFITPSNYLYSHNVNTAIISMSCAISLDYSPEKVFKIGCAAFLHDIGIVEFIDIIKNERRLSSEEINIIRQHSEHGVKILDRITDLDYESKKTFSRMIMEVHERYDGSGYPKGIKGEELDESASLIAIADTYEALSHKRNWRDAYEPPVAMRFFLNEFKGQFHPRALKALILSMGMYPSGSIVKLSSEEIAVVVLPNKKNITRPVVEVVLDSAFSPIKPYYLDLTEHPLIAIEDELLYPQIADRNPAFYSNFEMSHFWLNWG